MLFYIKYGCSVSHESLIVDADTYERAEDYAEASAQDVYYSYDCNYMSEEEYESYSEEEIAEFEYEDMISDIDWVVEPYDEKNVEHYDAFVEQGKIPFEI